MFFTPLHQFEYKQTLIKHIGKALITVHIWWSMSLYSSSGSPQEKVAAKGTTDYEHLDFQLNKAVESAIETAKTEMDM